MTLFSVYVPELLAYVSSMLCLFFVRRVYTIRHGRSQNCVPSLVLDVYVCAFVEQYMYVYIFFLTWL